MKKKHRVLSFLALLLKVFFSPDFLSSFITFDTNNTTVIMDALDETKTLAFLDLETTGLKDPKKVTELAIVACSIDHFMQAGDQFPRVHHKITTCYNPGKRMELGAARITGLNNDNLASQNLFNSTPIIEFLKQLQQPVCLIAHNGDQFDFPILKEEFSSSKDEILNKLKCCDSLTIFRHIFNSDGKKHRLMDVHERLFNQDPENSHEAEGDVKTLMKCAIATKDKFVALLLKQQKFFLAEP